jgi:hypothetical protein
VIGSFFLREDEAFLDLRSFERAVKAVTFFDKHIGRDAALDNSRSDRTDGRGFISALENGTSVDEADFCCELVARPTFRKKRRKLSIISHWQFSSYELAAIGIEPMTCGP